MCKTETKSVKPSPIIKSQINNGSAVKSISEKIKYVEKIGK